MGKKELVWKRPETKTNSLQSTLNRFSQVDKEVTQIESVHAEQVTAQVTERVSAPAAVLPIVQVKEQVTAGAATHQTVSVKAQLAKQVTADHSAQLAEQVSVLQTEQDTAQLTVAEIEQPPAQPVEQGTARATALLTAPVDVDPSEWQAIADTHTESEQRVYTAMYIETRKYGGADRYFTTQNIGEFTGLKHRQNIMDILAKLTAKKSIAVISTRRGEQFGKEYRVFSPSEIVKNRSKARIKIHPQTKRIV